MIASHTTGSRVEEEVSSGPTDQDLVLLLRRRQAGAFDEIFRRYRDRIWRFLVRLAGRVDRAEDLFQETWLAAARHAHQLRDGTDLGAWLYTIARNKHRNGVRFDVFDARKRARLQALEPGPAQAAGPEEGADARQRTARMAARFERLPVAYREVLSLALVEGLPTRDIARILGMKEDAVRKRLSRARQQLASDAIDKEGTPP